MINFDALVDAVYHRKDSAEPQREDRNALWKAFFELDSWLFITDATTASTQQMPFVGRIDNEPWFFVFTDSQKAFEFGKKFNLLDKDDKCVYISMEPSTTFSFLKSAEGRVQGIRINEGPHGWFSPLENVGRIHDYLINEGLLTAKK